MADTPRTREVRNVYSASAEGDFGPLLGLYADAITFHVAGQHPLAGDYQGREAVQGYLRAVASTAGGRSGFAVTSAFTDETEDLVLVEGTAFHGDPPFVRPVVHLLRFEDGRVVEFWDNPFDQAAEDRFWRSRTIPAQRDRRTPRPGGPISRPLSRMLGGEAPPPPLD